MGSWFSSELDPEEEEHLDPPTCDIGDYINLKAQTDEAVCKAMEREGFPSDNFWPDVKLLIMALACAVASLGQFFPMEFPKSKPLLAVCVFLYFLLSGLLQAIVTFVDANVVYSSLERPASTANAKAMAVCVRADFPRYQEMYTLTIEKVAPKSEDGTAAAPLSVSKSFSVGKVWTVDGELWCAGVRQIVHELIAELETLASKKAH